MSQIPSNIVKPLELLSRTFPTPINDQEHSMKQSQILPKTCTNQSFRRNSVHDIEQTQREDFQKVNCEENYSFGKNSLFRS